MKIICGVDVSMATLDICIEPGSIGGSFKNTAAGIRALAAFCRQPSPREERGEGEVVRAVST
jgi:hypothetical protein